MYSMYFKSKCLKMSRMKLIINCVHIKFEGLKASASFTHFQLSFYFPYYCTDLLQCFSLGKALFYLNTKIKIWLEE